MLEVGDFVIFKEDQNIGDRFKHVIYKLIKIDEREKCWFEFHAKLPKASESYIIDPRGQYGSIISCCNKILLNEK